MDKLNAMQVFVQVTECGSFWRAAEVLNCSNATVTYQIRTLERHLGARLIDRDTRRIKLTPEGELYLQNARSVLSLVEQGEARMQDGNIQLEGGINLQCPFAIGHTIIAPKLLQFSQRFPEVSVSVTLSNEPHNLIERGIDLALRVGAVDNAELIAKPLCNIRYILCCASALVESLPDHPARLDHKKCNGLLPQERYIPRQWELQRGDEVVIIQPGGPLHFNSATALVESARYGLGITCVYDILANQYLQDGSLVQVYPDWKIAERTLYIVALKSRIGSARIKRFIKFLEDIFSTQPRSDLGEPVHIRTRGKD